MSSSVSSPPLPLAPLRAELLDALAEAVASPPDPAARAEVVDALIREVAATLQWRHGFDQTHDELVSFEEVVAAVEHHRDRMHPTSG